MGGSLVSLDPSTIGNWSTLRDFFTCSKEYSEFVERHLEGMKFNGE